MSKLEIIKTKTEPRLLGPCLRCDTGIITDIDLDLIHCFACGEYYFELEEGAD